MGEGVGRALLDALSQWAAAKPLILELHVFGSRARAEGRPDSDLDIAIALDERVWRDEGDASEVSAWMHGTAGWRSELVELVPWQVDLQQLDAESPTIVAGVQRSSILVYQKSAPYPN